MGPHPSVGRLKGCITVLMITFALIPAIISAALPTPTQIDDVATPLSTDRTALDPVDENFINGNELDTQVSKGLYETNTPHDDNLNDHPLSPDPYKWKLVCTDDHKEFSVSLTQVCLTRRFKCNEDGKLTKGKDNAECNSCRCYEWSTGEGKPPTINDPPDIVRRLASRIGKPSLFDFVDYIRTAPRSDHPNLRPQESESNAAKNNVNDGPGLSPRAALHDWTVACYASDGRINTALGRLCISPPWGYTCNANRQLSWRREQGACKDFCRCQLMNPVPKILNWSPNQVPKGGSWDKRSIAPENGKAQELSAWGSPDSQDRTIGALPASTASDQGDVIDADETFAEGEASPHILSPFHLPIIKKVLHDWGPVCKLRDAQGSIIQDANFTRYCTRAPWSYSCDHRSALISAGYNLMCEDGCECKNFNPRPFILFWPYDKVPKPGSWSAKQHEESARGDRDEATNTAEESATPTHLITNESSLPATGSFEQLSAYTELGHLGAAAQSASLDFQSHNDGDTVSESSGLETRAPEHLRALICNLFNHEWTIICTGHPYNYDCDEDGKMTREQDWSECSNRCTCYAMNPQPHTIPLTWPVGPSSQGGSRTTKRLERRDGTTYDANEVSGTFSPKDSRATLHDMAVVCSDRVGNSRDWMEICIGSPYTYRCDKHGKMTYNRRYDECDRKCVCHNMNPLPKVLNWAVGQVPKGGSWDRRDAQPISDGATVATAKATGMSKATLQHDHPPGGLVFYELICFKAGKADETLTKSCDFAPWVYGCDMSGNLSMLESRDDCQRLCQCVPENVRPIVLNWPPGRVPLPGHWKRAGFENAPERDSADKVLQIDDGINAEDVAADSKAIQDTPEEHISHRGPLHDWAMICYPNDSPSKVWTELCHNEPWKYECTYSGKMQYKRKYNQCDRLCRCSNVNPRPYFPVGVPVSPPRSLVDGFDSTSRLQNSGVLDKDVSGQRLDADQNESISRTDSETQDHALEKRHGWSPTCRRWDTSTMTWIPDQGITKGCMSSPYLINCNAKGERTFAKNHFSQDCDEACKCVNMDPKPKIVNWLANQVPKSGTWSRFLQMVKKLFGSSENAEQFDQKEKQSSWSNKNTVESDSSIEELHADDFSPPGTDETTAVQPDGDTFELESDSLHQIDSSEDDTATLSKRHSYGVVCELDGKRDGQVTASCTHPPRSYSCDKRGVLTKVKYDSYCDQHCACHNMNPRPFIIGTPVGSMPKPCAWCKRDQNGKVINPGTTSDTQEQPTVDTASGALEARDKVWVMDCDREDGSQDLDLVRRCGLLEEVGCDDEGAIYSGQGQVEGKCARLCFCYLRPV